MPHSISPDSERGPSGPGESMAQQTAQDDGESLDMDGDITMLEPRALPSTAAVGEEKQDVNLEELFDDVDTEDEFVSSGPAGKAQQGGSSPSHMPSSPIDAGRSATASDPEVMRIFYQRLFPWRYLFQWLNHSPTPSNDFGHREFAFTLQNDAYLRYQAYASADLLRRDVLRLLPSRFEIGPVYTTNPRDRKTLRNSSAFRPLAKELCFDIDLTDYDGIRTCCDKANICRRCWAFITMAIKVVDAALRDDFGFRHILWVYSGRRGAHAWVCDRKARTMSDQKRRAVAGYLEVVRGGAQGGKRVNVRRPLHPHLSRSLEILAPHFQTDVLDSQDPWSSSARAGQLLALLPDRNLNDALARKWEASPGRSSASKWGDIDAVARSGSCRGLDAKALLEAKQDIVLEYTYPRLDIEVSKKLNHLLKSPFVVHPGTGRVCVPIDTRNLDGFDPLAVPTVAALLAELDGWAAESDVQRPGGRAAQGWEKTSLKPYIDLFRAFVQALMQEERADDVNVKREREGAGLDF